MFTRRLLVVIQYSNTFKDDKGWLSILTLSFKIPGKWVRSRQCIYINPYPFNICHPPQARPAARLPERSDDQDTKISLDSLNTSNRKKQRRGGLRRRFPRTTSSPDEVPETTAMTTAPSTMQWEAMTSSNIPDTTTSDEHRLLVRWWSGTVWSKDATRRPLLRKKLQRRRYKSPLKVWRKKAAYQKRQKGNID